MTRRSLNIGLLLALLIATLLSLGGLSAQPADIFVRNQQVEVDRTTGSVSVIHFFRLLDKDEKDQVKLNGRTLLVNDKAGVSHTFTLTESRRFEQWEEALGLLGYVRRVNNETGVIDFHLATAESTKTDEVVLEPEAVRLERSLRRPGYLKAQDTYKKIVQQVGLSEDDALRGNVDRLGQIIAARSPLSGLKWNFDVIDTPVPNALCTGEGHVLVTTGLLDLNLSDDELAGVLGHEVAHGVRRHAELYEERYTEYSRLRSELIQLQYQLNVAKDDDDRYKVQRIESQMKEREKRYKFVIDYLKNRRDYNQDEEEEADVLGMQYAASAGFDPMGEARALIKLKKKSVQLFGQSYDSSNRTHPPLDRRLQILETVQQRWRNQ